MDHESTILNGEDNSRLPENSNEEVFKDYIDFLLYGTSDDDMQF